MIKALLRTLFILIILLIALFAFLLTPIGLRFGVNVISKITDHQFSYQKISGVFIGPITVHHFKYDNMGQTISIDKLRMNWNLIDLFEGKLHISSLDVNHLTILNKETNNNAWNFKTTEEIIGDIVNTIKNKKLPFHVVINHTHFINTQIVDHFTGADFKISNIFLHAFFTKKNWDFDFLATLQKPQPLTIHFSLKGKPTQYIIQADLNGIHTRWQLMGHGNCQSLTLHTPENLFLNGLLKSDVKINWENNVIWQGLLTAKKIDLSLLNSVWINTITMQLNSNGNDGKNFTTDNKLWVKTPAGELHLTVQHDHHWHVKLSAQLLADKNKITHTTLTLNGDNQKQVTQGTITFKKLNIHFALDTDFYDDKWHGTLHQFSVAIKNAAPWTLENKVKIIASSKLFKSTLFCLKAPNTGHLCIQGNFAHQQIVANAHIYIHQFSWLRPWMRYARIPQGQLVANIAIKGNAAEPNITGSINLNQGDIIFPQLNISLKKISASMTGKGSALNFKAQAFSEQQPINLQGTIDLSQSEFLANLVLIANNILIINTEEYKTYVTSHLSATIKNKNIFLTGSIIIPEGKIAPGDYHIITTLPENDVVYVGNIVHPPKSFWAINTDVNVKIGDIVYVQASGAKAQLGGNIQLSQQPNQAIFGTGDVFVRKGTFSIYGQTLNIEPNSYLSFSHSLLDNPTLNIKASKIIPSVNNFSDRKLMVGVELQGTMKQPKVKFFSNRGDLSQANILSYLLLGYGNDSNTPGNTDFLLDALSAVSITSQGLLGKQNLASQIESGLGLSELGVESETTNDSLGNPLDNQSAFVVGKHLSRNLYARYSFGLGSIDPGNVFELRYLFNKHWAAQADPTQLGNGGDIIYTIEKK